MASSHTRSLLTHHPPPPFFSLRPPGMKFCLKLGPSSLSLPRHGLQSHKPQLWETGPAPAAQQARGSQRPGPSLTTGVGGRVGWGRVRWGGAVRERYIQTIFWERKCHFHNVLFEVLFAHPRGLNSQLCYALEFLRELSAWVPPRGGCPWHGRGPGRHSVKASQMASVCSQGGHPLLRSHIPSSQKQ